MVVQKYSHRETEHANNWYSARNSVCVGLSTDVLFKVDTHDQRWNL